jgi:hypothetical protein
VTGVTAAAAAAAKCAMISLLNKRRAFALSAVHHFQWWGP